MKRYLIILLALCLVIPVQAKKLKKKAHMPFDVEAYKAAPIDHLNYYLAMANWEFLRDHGGGIKKVAITEFNVEYPFYFNGRPKDFEQHKIFAKMAYDEFVANISRITGWEFIPVEDVMATQAYADLYHMEVDAMNGPPCGAYIDMADHYKLTLIVPAYGMKITSAVRRSNYGDREAEEFMKLNWPIEPRVMIESGADAILKVHLQVMLDQTHSKEKGMKHRTCVIIPDHIPGVDRPQEITLAFDATPEGFRKVVTTNPVRDKKDKNRRDIMANTPVDKYFIKGTYWGLTPESFEPGFKFVVKNYTDMYGSLAKAALGN